nr:hypothetical protein [Tanacetum cinerariifolium]
MARVRLSMVVTSYMVAKVGDGGAWEVSFSVPTGGIYGEVGVNTFRNAIGAHYIPYSREYVAPPSIDIVRPWFETIGYGEIVRVKWTLKKSLLPPSLANGTIDYASIFWEDIIIKLNKRHSGVHKDDQQATGGPTSLGVTSEARANPQLSSGMSAFNLNEPIYSASFNIYSKSASGNDASAISTAEVDLGKLAPNKTQSVSEGLEIVLTQPTTRKGASSIARQVNEDETSRTIKNEDEEADEVLATTNVETKDTSSPKSSSLRSSRIQELTNQVLILQSQNHKLELKKNKAEAALLKAQPFVPNVGQFNELLELPAKFLSVPSQVKMVQVKLKTLDALPSLLNKVTNALNQSAQAIASNTTGDTSVPSAGQVGTQPAEGKKNIN